MKKEDEEENREEREDNEGMGIMEEGQGEGRKMGREEGMVKEREPWLSVEE